MRKRIISLLLLCSGYVYAGDDVLYKYTDENGNVIYTNLLNTVKNKPAKKIEVNNKVGKIKSQLDEDNKNMQNVILSNINNNQSSPTILNQPPINIKDNQNLSIAPISLPPANLK